MNWPVATFHESSRALTAVVINVLAKHFQVKFLQMAIDLSNT